MKGILGRKIGMTQVFTNHGEAIAVSVVEVKQNVVTAILTKEKNGYNAIQLAVEDVKKSRQRKPEVGHFKKANTTQKRFVKEIKGATEFTLGQIIDASIFAPGELVDVTGTSKGKGFAGAIKRHNQSIGPKSHGGGGGSQPQRQTGSLGDIAGNKVVKGMTMPGHMGAQQTTVQNLEVIAVDLTNSAILIKGSIPGPKKSFVVIREAVKGLPKKEAAELVNLRMVQLKNELLEDAKKAGADVNTDMTIEEMQAAVKAAQDAKAAQREALDAKREVEELKEKAKKIELAAQKAKEQAEQANESGDKEAKKEAEDKAKVLEAQAEKAVEKVSEAKIEAKDAKKEAKVAAKAAEKLQVETTSEADDNKGDK